MMAVIYLLPITGILFRSLQAPQEFLDVELKTIPMIPEVVTGFAMASLVTLGVYAVRQAGALRDGSFSLPYNAFLASHLVVFGIAYFALSINHGWLVVNVWHNAQYLLMVWLFNNKQFKDQIVPDRPFASKLSQRKHVLLFFGATLALSTVAYLVLGVTVALLTTSALPIALMTYQAINFHHYIVDSFIWKSRRPKVREDLGIQAAA
jgi:4-hydroxybenzoate polyprenyltransferase